MNKTHLHQRFVERLNADLHNAQLALQTAHEAATHEENVAENKYDTLGLEAGYLAHGQARRVAEIEQALLAFRALQLREFDADKGIQLSALVLLESASGHQRRLFLVPDGAGMKVPTEQGEVMSITPQSPMGQSLLGKAPGDVVLVNGQESEVIEVC
jgi:transcription elongation GreA/GreB family factor